MKRLLTACLAAVLMLAAGAAWAQDMPAAAQQTQKVVYLTFDDGPKASTPELVALLDELDVPATFFFVGLAVRAFPQEAKLVVDAGHAVGCHTMSHSPSMLKKDLSYIGRDIDRFVKTMQELVDPAFTTDLYRFPGGSTSYAYKTKRAVVEAGFSWFDWNAMTADTHKGMTAESIYDYAVKTSGEQEVIVLLMHENKTGTRRMLPDLVAYYREKGYVFRTLSTSEEERAILARSGVKMMMPELPGKTDDVNHAGGGTK